MTTTSSTPDHRQIIPRSLHAPSRLLSLDVLRGLTIAFMILVNNNGNEAAAYWPLKHAAWNGFTPTDLVFPTFLFLVGISTVFSTASRLAQGATNAIALPSRPSPVHHPLSARPRREQLPLLPSAHHALLRSAPAHRHLLSHRCLALSHQPWLAQQGRFWQSRALVGYWILMRFVPVPGYGVPGHDIPLLDRDANLTAWLDRQIFSPSHLYEHTRDPEGLLSTIPAIATTLLGLLTGIWLRTQRTLAAKSAGNRHRWP